MPQAPEANLPSVSVLSLPRGFHAVCTRAVDTRRWNSSTRCNSATFWHCHRHKLHAALLTHFMEYGTHPEYSGLCTYTGRQ